ncbi:MAG: hypothetical protein EXR68_03340 [Dehalococcoidia bacterium]|nr:hypothetical protein [Dehalococcoidia bacterium]
MANKLTPILIVMFAGWFLAGISQVQAAPASPIAGYAWYIGTLGWGTLYEVGCSSGRIDRDTPGTQYRMLTVDFGQAWYQGGRWGANMHNNQFVNDTQIEMASRTVVQGYYSCVQGNSGSQILLAITTNNYGIGGVTWSPLWYQADVVYMSWALGAARAAPQIYFPSTQVAHVWKYIKLYDYLYARTGMTMSGATTQWSACVQTGFSAQGCMNGSQQTATPSEGWGALWDALASDSRAVQTSLTYSTDYKW